jgi:hypothetical protein
MASCPFVRNRKSSGRPVTSAFTGSLTCSSGICCRAPASAWPAFSRTKVCTRPDHGKLHYRQPCAACIKACQS